MKGNGDHPKRTDETEPLPTVPDDLSSSAEELGELLATEGLSGENAEQVRRIVRYIASAYAGPLPPAETLAGYAKIYPQAPEIIFTSFQEEAKHRREMERRELEAETALAYFRTKCAVGIFLLIVGLAFFAVYRNYPIQGTVIALGPLLSIVGLIIYGLHRRR